MAHSIVRIISDDSGVTYDNPNDFHLVDTITGEMVIYCSGEYFGYGSGAAVVADFTNVKSGGITCPACLNKIKQIKSIKL